MRVRLTAEPDGSICVESPYDRTFVDGLKEAIAYGGRQWDGQRKRWLVSALYEPELLAYFQRAGVELRDDRAGAAPGAVTHVPPMPADLKEAFDALFLAYTAPLCVAEAAYRALSKVFHPDRGGAPEDFHAASTAITVVRRYLDPQPETVTDDNDLPF